MEYTGYGVLVALGSVVLYANLPIKYTHIGLKKPTFAHLAKAKLNLVKGEPSTPEILDSIQITGEELLKKGPALIMAVRRPGCLFCRKEAEQLRTLKGLLQENGIRLMAVAHETLGVNSFKKWFPEDVYYDNEKTFYGPHQRWMPVWMGALRVSTYINYYNARQTGHDGNLKGEGRLLGGVYLVANGDIVYTHLEKEWGDAANVEEVKEAIINFSKSQ